MTKLNNFFLNEIEAQMSLTKNADMQTWKMGTTLLVLMIVSITSIITQKSAILQRVAKSCPSWPGPSGIKNFNPGIFQDGILPNPGIPGFFGTGFPNIFDPGISGKSFGIFRDFHFCFICMSNRIIFINLYHHLRHNHHPPPHYHQIYVRNHIVTMPILVPMC